MAEINIEPKVTKILEETAKAAAKKIDQTVEMTTEQLLKHEYENPVAPVNSQGTLDHSFLEQIKSLTVWKDRDRVTPDYVRTRELRALAYEGYERKKSGKPLPARVVSEDEIRAAISGRIEKASKAPEIVFNRHVHTME